MMTFKDLRKQDLDVFFNAEELAEPHDLNGKICNVIVGSAISKAPFLKPVVTFDNFDSNNITICCKASDLKEIPKKGNQFKFDSKLYRVQQSGEIKGVATIVLGVDSMFG